MLTRQAPARAVSTGVGPAETELVAEVGRQTSAYFRTISVVSRVAWLWRRVVVGVDRATLTVVMAGSLQARTAWDISEGLEQLWIWIVERLILITFLLGKAKKILKQVVVGVQVT